MFYSRLWGTVRKITNRAKMCKDNWLCGISAYNGQKCRKRKRNAQSHSTQYCSWSIWGHVSSIFVPFLFHLENSIPFSKVIDKITIWGTEMVPQITGSNSSFRSFVSGAHLIGQLANWVIGHFFEVELGRGNGSDWHATQRNKFFRPKFAKMAQESWFSAEKIEQKTEVSESKDEHFWSVGRSNLRSANDSPGRWEQ